MRFWRLSPPDSSKELAKWDETVALDGPVFCSATPDHQRAGKRESSLSLYLPSQVTSDIVWTWYSECLIQDHVLQLFRRFEISGFEVRQARGRVKATERFLPLHEIVVTGWGGIAPEKSGVRLIENCQTCGLKRYSGFQNPSLLIEESQWDGSDFFIVWPLPRIIFVSDRAAQVIRENALTGAVLKKPSDLKPALLNELSPGRLSYWMPEKRAHELGDPLGVY